MATDEFIHVAQAPGGFSVRRIGGTAVLLGAVLLLLPPLWPGLWTRLALGAALFGAAAAQQYGRRCALTSSAVLLLGPLGCHVVPLQNVLRLCIGRRGPMSRGLAASLRSGGALLPSTWSGVELGLHDGSRLFVPAADAHGLARKILELRPEIRWDDLSENDYFAFLAHRRPETWLRLTRSCTPSASTPSPGCKPSPSVRSRV